MTTARRELENRLADPTLYSGPADSVRRLQIELAETARQLEEAEESWLGALEAYESAADQA